MAQVIKNGDVEAKKLLEDAQSHAEAALEAAKKDYEKAKSIFQTSELRSYVQTKLAKGKEAAVALVEEVKKEATQAVAAVEKEAANLAQEVKKDAAQVAEAVEKATAPVKRAAARKAPAKKATTEAATPAAPKRPATRKAPVKKLQLLMQHQLQQTLLLLKPLQPLAATKHQPPKYFVVDVQGRP